MKSIQGKFVTLSLVSILLSTPDFRSSLAPFAPI